MKCPKCSSSELEPLNLKNISVDRCPECHGFYLDGNELEKLVSLDDIGDADSEEFTEMSDRKDMETAHCPRCDQDMEPDWGPANMRIDRCPKCKAVVLDQGELATIHKAT